MRAPLRLAVLLPLLGGLLAACAMDDPSNHFQQLSFKDRPPINLDVGEVRIEQDYVTAGKDPYVDFRFPVQPKDAAVRWAQDRLVAKGDRLTFNYIVHDASAIETALPKTTGLTGLLTTDQSARYEVHIAVEMQVRDGRQVLGTAQAEARRSVTVAEDVSVNERERVWYKLTREIMDDLDKQLEKTIREAFFPYIVL